MAEIGSILDNKYEILTEIGRGGMSVVYLAMDRRLNRQWAVKEVRKRANDANNDLVVTSLQAEANLMKSLDHPRIPRIVDIIENDETIYVVMDYMPGKSLDKILQERKAPLPQEAVINIGIQLCDALGYLHSQKPPIIYRDMKPANVMLKNPDNTDPDKISVMLFDFGIAREYKENRSGDTKLMGTPGFASPEQYRTGKQTDARSDIYCLGVTLYNLVTGHSPVQDNCLYPIRRWNPELSGGLEKIILKCTAAEPEERYQSCEEIAAALENYEAYDDTYRREQKSQFRLFLIPAILAVVCLAGGLVCRLLYNGERSSGYDELVTAAADAADEYLADTENSAAGTSYDSAVENYYTAIQTDPGRAEAYEGMIELFRGDGSFSSEEDTILRTDIVPNIAEVRGSSTADYMDLCYEIGRLYWFYYDQNGDSISGMKSSLRWFENVHELYTDEGEGFAQRDLNEVFYTIAGFYSEISQIIEEGENYDFVGLFTNLQTLMGYINSGTISQELMQWQACKVVVNVLENYMQKFRAAGVGESDMRALVSEVQQLAETMEASTDKTADIQIYVQGQLPDLLTKIDSNYT